jgi:hypothetical protein
MQALQAQPHSNETMLAKTIPAKIEHQHVQTGQAEQATQSNIKSGFFEGKPISWL